MKRIKYFILLVATSVFAISCDGYIIPGPLPDSTVDFRTLENARMIAKIVDEGLEARESVEWGSPLDIMVEYKSGGNSHKSGGNSQKSDARSAALKKMQIVTKEYNNAGFFYEARYVFDAIAAISLTADTPLYGRPAGAELIDLYMFECYTLVFSFPEADIKVAPMHPPFVYEVSDWIEGKHIAPMLNRLTPKVAVQDDEFVSEITFTLSYRYNYNFFFTETFTQKFHQ